MIRINISRNHPVTITTDDKRQFHFAQVVAASRDTIQLRLRKVVPSIALLDTRSLIIETFAQLSDVRLGTVTVEVDCLNVSSVRDRFLKLRFQDAPALEIRVIPEKPTND